MPVVSQTIPNFLNGVSEQSPTQRGINPVSYTHLRAHET